MTRRTPSRKPSVSMCIVHIKMDGSKNNINSLENERMSSDR